MQRSQLQSSKSDIVVHDTWEELADALEMAMPEPVEIEKKLKTKKTLQGTSTDLDKIESRINPPVNQSEARIPTSPDFGKVRILKRDPNSNSNPQLKLGAGTPTPPPKTYEERVAAYNEARMRIFGCLDDEELQNSSSSATDDFPGSVAPR